MRFPFPYRSIIEGSDGDVTDSWRCIKPPKWQMHNGEKDYGVGMESGGENSPYFSHRLNMAKEEHCVTTPEQWITVEP